MLHYLCFACVLEKAAHIVLQRVKIPDNGVRELEPDVEMSDTGGQSNLHIVTPSEDRLDLLCRVEACSPAISRRAGWHLHPHILSSTLRS